MSTLRQTFATTELALRGLPARLGTSLVIVVGVATVVTVLVSVLAVATSFTRTALSTGREDRAIVLGEGAESEAGSFVRRENAVTIMDAPGVARTADGQSVASPERLVSVPLVNERTGVDAFVMLRGVGTQMSTLRPEIRLVEGRVFERGAHEVIVGRAVQKRLGGVEIGSRITMPDGEWLVVGVFESGGDSHESEMLTDVETLLSAYRQSGYNSVTVALDGPQGFERLQAAIAADPSLAATARREIEYFATASQFVSRLLTFVAYGIGSIMTLGAAFGALNTLYSAVSTRAHEIATPRAIGFGAGPVVASVLLEALALALAGALIGTSIAWFLFQGATVSAMSGVSPSQLTFALSITPRLVIVGIATACAIAAVGGIFAATRAARVPVALALRAG